MLPLSLVNVPFKCLIFVALTLALAGGQAHGRAVVSGTRRGDDAAKPNARATAPPSPSTPAPTSRDLSRYEGRAVGSVEVLIEEAAPGEALVAELRALLRVATGQAFSAVSVRESLQALFDSGRVARARVEALDAPGRGGGGRAPLTLRFVVRPHVLVERVDVELAGAAPGAPVAEGDLRARLQFLEPGRPATEQALRDNADLIQAYLRDRGFFRAGVDYEQRLDQTRTRAVVTYRVAPGEQATVGSFDVNVAGFDGAKVKPELKLQPGAPFTQESLGEDVGRVRRAVIAEGYLAPRLDEPRFRLDSERNTVNVELRGAVGPKVNVVVKDLDLSEKRARELLPVMREGTVNLAAVKEGERRLRNRLQEDGFFFADVQARCEVAPPLEAAAANGADAAAEDPATATCANLDPEGLTGRTVTITYEVANQLRRFRLNDIRIVEAEGGGPTAISYEDVADDLRSREANLLGVLPLIRYGRGYTSNEALEQDRRTIVARLRELGYRNPSVEVRQGVPLEGEGLIVTFAVTRGPLTRVAGVETRGNQIFTGEQLREAACPAERAPEETCTVLEGPYSRTQARADADRIRSFYARHGYVDADVGIVVVDLPARGGDERVRVVYEIKEAEKVFVNRVIVNGAVATDEDAIREAIPLRQGEPLRADRIAEAERTLYSTDAFHQVIIRTEPAVETAAGYKARDVVIDLEERKRYTMDYGGGYSTDSGPLGLFEIRNQNLFGALRQGALRARGSRRQQLVRLEYFDPRFRRYGERAFAPLTASVQYQLDSTVTRFFRSTIDRGAFGIVQRLDPEGRPIDVNCPLIDFDPDAENLPEACRPIGDPTINRFTVNVETQRDFELKLGPRGEVRKRSTLFLRYNYEDVRLFNTQSLLIAPILRPDRAVRLSRFGATFVRDARDRGLDATRGDFLSVDYALALKALGGSLSFSKLLANYRRYYTVPRARGTVLAAGLQLGLARLYGAEDRGGDGVVDAFDRTLPISERFFSGGSTTLRGFGAEEAGPRVIVPGGVFRNEQGEQVAVNPFSVPIGGNALAVVNLEARVPVTKNIQVVPFYDGGNVFRQAGDIFKRNCGSESADPVTRNLCTSWTHTVGLGLRFKTPVGPLAVDYGFLLNPPEFLLPQASGVPAILRPRNAQLHFRFGQTF